MTTNFSYVRVDSVKDAVTHLSSKGSRLLAGGTDLLGCLRDGVFDAEKVVAVSRVADLRGIKETPEGGLRIGAGVTIAEIVEHPLILERYPALAQAAASVGTPQLRNQGTIGGNVCQKYRCWYYRGDFDCLRKGGETCFAMKGDNRYHAVFGADGTCAAVHPSDTAPALTAYRATARVVGRKGARTIPLAKFFVPPVVDPRKETVLEQGDIVTDFLIPKPSASQKSVYRKVRARRAWDFALVGAAVVLSFHEDKVDRADIVFSGVAPVPWPAKEAQDGLIGKKLDTRAVTAAAKAAATNAEPLDDNAYKVTMMKAIIEEELTKMAGG